MTRPMITYIHSTEDVAPAQLKGFFEGWLDPPSPEVHLELLNNSDCVVLAKSSEGHVIGYVTALTDGVMTAYVSFLEVLPEFRGRGIGTELMKRLIQRWERLYSIDLMCDPEVAPFYENLGFQPGNGMMIRRYTSNVQTNLL